MGISNINSPLSSDWVPVSDGFDTIFCVGKHHINEIHKNEKKYALPAKKLIEFGYGKLDQLIDEANNKKIKSVQKNNRTDSS